MKKKVLLSIFFALACSSCHAQEPQKKTTNKQEITKTPQVAVQQQFSTQQTEIALDCSEFQLDHQDKLLCEYWKKSGRLDYFPDMKYFKSNYPINFVRDMSPPDYAYSASTKLRYNNTNYDVTIYPSSWIILENPNQRVKSELSGKMENEKQYYICQNAKCQDLFLWGFSDDGIAGEHPEMEEKVQRQYEQLVAQVTQNTNQSNQQTITADKALIKLYLDTDKDNLPAFVMRPVSKQIPLKDSIQAYLTGATTQESQQGYQTNNLGIHDFDVTVKNKTAFIHFRTDDLQVENPQQVIDFTYNISQIAEQFPTVKKTKICINDIENYQVAFFANKPEVKCKF